MCLAEKKVGTTIFVGFCLFCIGFLNPRFWDKAIETTTIVLIGITLCVLVGIPIGIAMARNSKVRNALLPILDLMQVIPSFLLSYSRYNFIWSWSDTSNNRNIYILLPAINSFNRSRDKVGR